MMKGSNGVMAALAGAMFLGACAEPPSEGEGKLAAESGDEIGMVMIDGVKCISVPIRWRKHLM